MDRQTFSSKDTQPVDVVWFKRDVRLRDHGPLATAAMSSERPIVLLYLYEPDQLAEQCVHGSHIAVVNEGLVDLDRQLSECATHHHSSHGSNRVTWLTLCYAGAVSTFQAIHQSVGIARLLAHEETGHLQSFARDRAVRKWCRQQSIPCLEFNQSGAIRGLKNRDAFSAKRKAFMEQPLHPTPHVAQLRPRVCQLSHLPGYTDHILPPDQLIEIPIQHRADRPHRQRGGEREGLAVLTSFLQRRGEGYASGISSPVTAWESGSRLSVALSWGHLSLRYVIQQTRQRQTELRLAKPPPGWLKSLAAFSSRLHWRSHFIQKLESEPQQQIQDLHSAYKNLRRQEGDWNESYYQAWCTGQTGFPFVDACMRCLLETGWINFRMRAMLVSFATYNLWLDWTRLTGHLARCFLDYEPGIHYPQIQMQAGTTGINTIRMYNVVKQGKEQDKEGTFVKKYVPELAQLPLNYLHTPWDLPFEQRRLIQYPDRIVDHEVSAREAKSKIYAIRNKTETRVEAQKVYEKHGSRLNREKRPIESDTTSKQIKIADMLGPQAKKRK